MYSGFDGFLVRIKTRELSNPRLDKLEIDRVSRESSSSTTLSSNEPHRRHAFRVTTVLGALRGTRFGSSEFVKANRAGVVHVLVGVAGFIQDKIHHPGCLPKRNFSRSKSSIGSFLVSNLAVSIERTLSLAIFQSL